MLFKINEGTEVLHSIRWDGETAIEDFLETFRAVMKPWAQSNTDFQVLIIPLPEPPDPETGF